MRGRSRKEIYLWYVFKGLERTGIIHKSRLSHFIKRHCDLRLLESSIKVFGNFCGSLMKMKKP
jgi:hypothetical protein